MGIWLKIVAVVVIVAGAGLAALVVSGVWPGPSAAERSHALLLFAQAESQFQDGDEEAALGSLNESVRVAPQTEALRMRASINVSRENFDQALADISGAIRRGPALAADYNTRCRLRLRDGKLNGARADCERALEMQPGFADALGNRGLVSLMQGRNREAWNDFNDALRAGGSGDGVPWRVFGRGLAAWNRGDIVEGRQDIQTGLIANPTVAAEFVELGVGVEALREFESASYAAATDPPSLMNLRQFLYVYPDGVHAAEAQANIDEIYARIAADEEAGRAATPGFSLVQDRGSGPASDSFGALAISRSSWRVAFVTDYATGAEAEIAAAQICNTGRVRDCEAFAFRNVCAALAISPADQVRGMAWSHWQDGAVRTAMLDCRQRGGGACAPVHSQCTPTPPAEIAPP